MLSSFSVLSSSDSYTASLPSLIPCLLSPQVASRLACLKRITNTYDVGLISAVSLVMDGQLLQGEEIKSMDVEGAERDLSVSANKAIKAVSEHLYTLLDCAPCAAMKSSSESRVRSYLLQHVCGGTNDSYVSLFSSPPHFFPHTYLFELASTCTSSMSSRTLYTLFAFSPCRDHDRRWLLDRLFEPVFFRFLGSVAESLGKTLKKNAKKVVEVALNLFPRGLLSHVCPLVWLLCYCFVIGQSLPLLFASQSRENTLNPLPPLTSFSIFLPLAALRFR